MAAPKTKSQQFLNNFLIKRAQFLEKAGTNKPGRRWESGIKVEIGVCLSLSLFKAVFFDNGSPPFVGNEIGGSWPLPPTLLLPQCGGPNTNRVVIT